MATPRPRQILRVDPLAVMAQLDRDFDDLVRRTWGSTPAGQGPRSGFVPPVDIVRDGADVVLRLEVPGLDPEHDLTLEVERGKLVITGERADSHAESSDDVLVRELRYGSFRREFALPEGVDESSVEADYDAGVLHVRLLGVAAPPPEPKKVAISVGNGSRRMIEGQPEPDREDGQG